MAEGVIFQWPSFLMPDWRGSKFDLPTRRFENLRAPWKQWWIEYTIGPEGLILHRCIWIDGPENGQEVTAEQLQREYRLVPKAWGKMAAAVLVHFDEFRRSQG